MTEYKLRILIRMSRETKIPFVKINFFELRSKEKGNPYTLLFSFLVLSMTLKFRNQNAVLTRNKEKPVT